MKNKLKKCYKDYSFTQYIVTFEDETGNQESQTIELKNEPTDEFLESFMEEQEFTRVKIKEIIRNVRTLGF